LPISEALCEHELDLEMAEVLSPRETLTTPINIVVVPSITVTPVVGLAVAVQAATVKANNVAALIQNVHV
jgi:hypothetical protein